MTSEDWKKLESRLCAPYGKALIWCDEYSICLSTEPRDRSPLNLCIAVYVKVDRGPYTAKGVWLMKDSDEQKTDLDRDISRRFLRPVKLMLYKNKQRDRLLSSDKNKEFWLKKFNIDLDASITMYDFRWGSFNALRRHLLKNNKDITLSPPQPHKIADLQGETES